MNEQTLIKRCKKGEKQAFEELIRLFYPYVFKFLLKAIGNETLAEDLTQDTFLKMIRGIEKYELDGRASFGTWLVSIAKNCYIDYMRRNNIQFENIDDLKLDSRLDISTNVVQKLQYEEICTAINKLPPEQGIAIRLKYEERLTLSEIAERFGVPPKTIKSRIHDGKVKLRRFLNLYERTDDYE